MARSVKGTLLGKANDPRIVEVDSQAIEVRPVDLLLVVRNVDKPGIVGKLGTILGDHSVNIANMSLSRADCGDLALTICELDEEPDEEALRMLEADHDIMEARISRQG
jgi:D-3-phosphoglycerate dehydrogenase